MKVTYYLDVVSSWCYWAEPAWTELKQRYAGRAEFGWKIAQMPADAYPRSRAQADWFFGRSGTIVRSPFRLNSGWWEPDIKQYVVPNLLAEAARELGVADDRVRLALTRGAVREGKKVGRWEVAAPIAAEAGGLNLSALVKRAKSAPVKVRVRESSAEFAALQINQRPAFLFENDIGDRAVYSGVVRVEPLVAAMEALLADEAAYASYAAHHGNPPA